MYITIPPEGAEIDMKLEAWLANGFVSIYVRIMLSCECHMISYEPAID